MRSSVRLLVVASVSISGCFDPTAVEGDTDATTGGSASSDGPGVDASTDGQTSMPDDGSGDDGSGDSADGTTGGTIDGGDPCDGDPCQNGGTCEPTDEGFVCGCPAGFEGDTCDVNVDDCGDAPCLNGGACVDGVDAFTCECPAGFEGDLCEVDIDECAAEPCQNGGTCTDAVGGFDCACLPGFEGDACETNIDECASAPCLNGGACVDGIDAFTCNCAAGFEGPTCACSVGPAAQANYTNQGTFTSATLYDDPPGITADGSNTINVLNLNGLGIVGGANNNTIDGSESIEFTFDDPSAATTYFVPSAGNQDGDGFVGEAFLQAFDEADASLGTTNVNGAGSFDINALLGTNARITRFIVTANVDSFRIGTVTVTPVVCR
jgi:hypothetical protein